MTVLMNTPLLQGIHDSKHQNCPATINLPNSSMKITLESLVENRGEESITLNQ